MNKNKLKQIFHTATKESIDEFYEYFQQYAKDFKVSTTTQENFFLAQVKAEVGTDLQSVRENLNYSCRALKLIFSYYKRNKAQANKDGRCKGHRANQINIGNKAYGNRLGNGLDNGYHFRGGGFFQLTGRYNYKAVVDRIQKSTGITLTIEEYAEKITSVKYGLLGALAFWENNKMYNCRNIDCCTRIINKHTNTYGKRKRYYRQIAAIKS